MIFKTEINPKPSVNKIDYTSSILLFGSCFSNHIGNKLDYFKFKVNSNPFGIIFQPKAIEKLVLKCLNNTLFTKDDLFYLNERWHCFDVHSDYSKTNKTEMLFQLNEIIKSTNKQIKNATHLVITLGTSWVYKHIKNQKYVANCHKVPQNNFEKELLSISALSESLQNIITQINQVNVNCKVIFTVSPVRHIKDGMVENNLSKAHLISAVHQVVKDNENATYFPSYELLLDDLRDYRFYKKDMIHPSDLAIDYIWNKFLESNISSSCDVPMKLMVDVQKGKQHKPFNSKSDAHQKFLINIENKKERLKTEFGIQF